MTCVSMLHKICKGNQDTQINVQKSLFQKLLYGSTVSLIAVYIIHVRSAFSLVTSCMLLKYTRTDDVN